MTVAMELTRGPRLAPMCEPCARWWETLNDQSGLYRLERLPAPAIRYTYGRAGAPADSALAVAVAGAIAAVVPGITGGCEPSRRDLQLIEAAVGALRDGHWLVEELAADAGTFDDEGWTPAALRRALLNQLRQQKTREGLLDQLASWIMANAADEINDGTSTSVDIAVRLLGRARADDHLLSTALDQLGGEGMRDGETPAQAVVRALTTSAKAQA
jgi:hypothetical protein